jgi:hypothetical protein
MLYWAFWMGAWKRFLDLVEETADMPKDPPQHEFKWTDPPPEPVKRSWWKFRFR